MTTVVIPYLHQLSQGDELRKALRSWCQFADFDFQPLIIGDRPEWYTGDHIQTVPIRGVTFARAFDIAKKLSIVVADPNVSDDFIYTYDDIYLLRTTPLTVFQQVIALERMPEGYSPPRASNRWKTLLKDTATALAINPIYNYETHLPRMFNKNKLASIISAYNLAKNPLLFSTLYYNEYHDPDVILTDENIYKAGIYQRTPYSKIKSAIQGKYFLNHSEEAYRDGMQRVLRELFSEKCTFEK